MTSRVYGKQINLDSESVRNFWNSKSSKEGLQSVLLGKSGNDEPQKYRNFIETNLLVSLLEKNHFLSKNLSVLDVGCGIGRWYSNLKEYISLYVGIDSSSNFINELSKRYKDEKNLKFVNCELENFDFSQFKKKFDLIIITGVLMYINDDFVQKILCNILNCLASSGAIYLQESVSLLNERLTLDNFFSDDLKSEYSAIYRTVSEYETYFNSALCSLNVKGKGLLLDEKSGARTESNAMYWLITKKNIEL